MVPLRSATSAFLPLKEQVRPHRVRYRVQKLERERRSHKLSTMVLKFAMDAVPNTSPPALKIPSPSWWDTEEDAP